MYVVRSGATLEDSAFSHNQAKERGGAIYVLQSQANITLLGQCNLTHNSADTGGAICADESTIVSLGYIYIPTQFSKLTIAFNTANYIGGGIYLHRSVFNSKKDSVTNILCNSANSSGGGIYATNSLIVCTEYYCHMNTRPYQTLIFFTYASLKEWTPIGKHGSSWLFQHMSYFLVAIVIIVCKYSGKFSRLLGKRNPEATLATLILLSHTKFLQTTIAALSIATLHYPDGSHMRVRLPDATVKYLSRKHISLFVVAVAILIVGTAYTCLLFFWQWLLHFQK